MCFFYNKYALKCPFGSDLRMSCKDKIKQKHRKKRPFFTFASQKDSPGNKLPLCGENSMCKSLNFALCLDIVGSLGGFGRIWEGFAWVWCIFCIFGKGRLSCRRFLDILFLVLAYLFIFLIYFYFFWKQKKKNYFFCFFFFLEKKIYWKKSNKNMSLSN